LYRRNYHWASESTTYILTPVVVITVRHWYDFNRKSYSSCSCIENAVTGATYREVNSKVATAPKLKVEDKDRVNNSRRIKTVKLDIVKLKASLN